jgi:hypothetical protein
MEKVREIAFMAFKPFRLLSTAPGGRCLEREYAPTGARNGRISNKKNAVKLFAAQEQIL